MPRANSGLVIAAYLKMAETFGWFDAETREDRRRVRGEFWRVMAG